MTTHDFVYQTFVIYLFIKSLVFAPLIWLAFMYWWSERQIQVPTEEININDSEDLLLSQSKPQSKPSYEAQIQNSQAA
jgi:hypothetical protein